MMSFVLMEVNTLHRHEIKCFVETVGPAQVTRVVADIMYGVNTETGTERLALTFSFLLYLKSNDE